MVDGRPNRAAGRYRHFNRGVAVARSPLTSVWSPTALTPAGALVWS